ncbi:MAG: hypothetical protein JSR69_00275 [Proteobacteria bacterium]|nr:hypothetical protein [Pseudomonadota bacterium]
MNTRIPQSCLAVAATTLCLAGCATVPMAPLVYGSKTVGGLDISTTTTGASPGVSISLGYKRDDLALVPVAVMQEKEGTNGKTLERVKIIRGHDIDSDDEDDAKSAGDAAPKGAKAPPKPMNDHSRKDAMSVFGSFEGRGLADSSTQTTRAQAIAANYFSTGIAAQNLARGLGNAAAADQLRKCFQIVKDLADGVPDADRPAYVKKGMDACSNAGAVAEK